MSIDEDDPHSSNEESQTASSQSQSSQASIPEQEITIWSDEMEDQNSKRQKLNEAVEDISGGRYSPVMSTLNTTWDDVSYTQQRYYIRKAKETIATSLSIIAPGQEEQMWAALQSERLFDADKSNPGKRKRFDPTISDKSSWNAHLTPCFTFKFKKKIQHPPFPPFNVDLTFRIAAANVCSNVGGVFPFLTTLKWGRGAPRNEPSFQQFCQ